MSPALPTILRALADRDIDATFYVGDELREREPLAVTMIRNGRHAVGSPADEPEPAVRDTPYLLDQGQEGGPAGANALHQALQLAVAAALRGRSDAVLLFTPGLLERADALAVFVETLELVEGATGCRKPALTRPATRRPRPCARGRSGGRRRTRGSSRPVRPRSASRCARRANSTSMTGSRRPWAMNTGRPVRSARLGSQPSTVGMNPEKAMMPAGTGRSPARPSE